MTVKFKSVKTQFRKLLHGSRACALTGPVPVMKPVLALLMRLCSFGTLGGQCYIVLQNANFARLPTQTKEWAVGYAYRVNIVCKLFVMKCLSI